MAFSCSLPSGAAEVAGAAELPWAACVLCPVHPLRAALQRHLSRLHLLVCISAGGHCNCICFVSCTIHRKIVKQQGRAEVRIREHDTERFRLAVRIQRNQKGPLQGLTKRCETVCIPLAGWHSLSQYCAGDFSTKLRWTTRHIHEDSVIPLSVQGARYP